LSVFAVLTVLPTRPHRPITTVTARLAVPAILAVSAICTIFDGCNTRLNRIANLIVARANVSLDLLKQINDYVHIALDHLCPLYAGVFYGLFDARKNFQLLFSSQRI
jgi:hypothetical protein